jgi:DNA-binding response OmpR family regulator
VLTDLCMPHLDGVALCRRIRAVSKVPILVLSVRATEEAKAEALDSGADDYMTKPFGVRELVARIHALLRRSQPAAATAASSDTPFEIGTAVIDPKRFELRRGKVTEELTARELKLLQLFHGAHGEVLSRDRLLNEVWGHGYFGTTRTLDQVIVQLRKKLGDAADHPKHLLTVHGVGYKLVL